MLHRFVALFLVCLIAVPVAAQPADRPTPGRVRVRIETSAGAITLSLDARRAPVTTANFMAYVDDGRFDGTTFYRSARRTNAPKLGLIQGGISTDARRALAPIAHESTAKTGIRHIDGTISMARGSAAGSAMGNFFITVGLTPHMDARPGAPGYAAFGQVVAGMDTVRRILALPTGGGSGAMKGQMILRPIRLISAKRLDGVAKPTGKVKVWLLGIPGRSTTS